MFFARRLYRLNLLTIGDYYRLRYNRTVEVLCTLCIVASYLGWVAAQIKALGLVFTVVTDGAVTQPLGMVIGTAIVLTYTTFGGMFSVAILDFVQITMIVTSPVADAPTVFTTIRCDQPGSRVRSCVALLRPSDESRHPRRTARYGRDIAPSP